MEKQQEKPTPQLERLNADLKRTIDLLEEQIFVLNEKLQKITRFNESTAGIDKEVNSISESEAPSALVVLEGSVYRLEKVSDKVGSYIRHLNEII